MNTSVGKQTDTGFLNIETKRIGVHSSHYYDSKFVVYVSRYTEGMVRLLSPIHVLRDLVEDMLQLNSL